MYYIFLKPKVSIMLKKSLAANLVFSACSGIFMLLTPDWLSQQMPAPSWLWTALGVGLLVFAIQLAAMLFVPSLARKLTMQVVASDLLWIAATITALVIFYGEISRTGVSLIIAVNVAVALLAVFQYRGYRSIYPKAL
jgi:ABC-type uncharacterized transport system permease subunit